MIAQCLHGLDGLGAGSLAVLLPALFVAGLAGGALHCAGMCGPFVLAQVAARDGAGAGGPLLARLGGAALLPYQVGRLTGYAALGAIAGFAGGIAGWAAGLQPVLGLLLLGAAGVLAAQGLGRVWPGFALWRPVRSLPAGQGRCAVGLLRRPTGWRGFVLGVVLSGLPCGLLWGALAAAAAAGSALAGGAAMAAFAFGTMPALVGVGWLGGFFARRAGGWLRPVAGVLMLANAGVLAAIALARLV